jgi:hypothetical protein
VTRRLLFTCAFTLTLVGGSAAVAGAADAGSFARQLAVRYHVDPGRVATADIDRDGDLDVVMATDRGFLVWVNDGAGRFTSQTAKHRPLIDGRDVADTWDAGCSAPEEWIPNGAPSMPIAAERAHAPPLFSSRSDVLIDSTRRADRTHGSSSPRAPPLA